MLINYKFNSDSEPTDEQLHLLMQEVVIEAKRKARLADLQFWENLKNQVEIAIKNNAILNSESK